jgi:hypothetical protein
MSSISFGDLEKPSRVLVDSALVGVGGVVDASTTVKVADVSAVETVSTPVFDLVSTVETLREAPEDSTVSVLDVATKIEAVRALPEDEKLAVSSLSPDLARLIATVDATPSLVPELIELPGPIIAPPILPTPTPFPTPLPLPIPLPTPTPVTPPAAPPLNTSPLVQLRAQLASLPVAKAGDTITAESFNALRAGIVAVLDAVLAAAGTAAPAAVAPTPTLPTRPFLEATELTRLRDVLTNDLSGARLLRTLSDKGLIS